MDLNLAMWHQGDLSRRVAQSPCHPPSISQCFTYLSVHLPIHLSTYLPIYPSPCLPIHPPIHPASTHPSIHLCPHPSSILLPIHSASNTTIHSFTCPFIHSPIHPPVFPSIDAYSPLSISVHPFINLLSQALIFLVHWFVCLAICLPLHTPIHPPIHPYTHLSIHLSTQPAAYLLGHSFIPLSIYLYIHPSTLPLSSLVFCLRSFV